MKQKTKKIESALLAIRDEIRHQQIPAQRDNTVGIGYIRRKPLPDPSVKQKVTVGFQADASLQERLESVALPVQAVDDLGSRFNEGSLQHVRQKRENGVKRSKVLCVAGGFAVLYTSEELSEDRKVEDQGSSEQRVLALVEDVDGATASAEDLRVVLVDGALGVTNSGNILDDDDVVGMLAFSDGNTLGADLGSLEEQTVRINHVVDDAALADLLALELPLRRQVVAVVVAEMVVRGDGERLDTGVDQELGEDGFEFGLAGLEIVAADEGLVALREGNDTGDKCVLGCAVDEGFALKDGSDGEQRGR